MGPLTRGALLLLIATPVLGQQQGGTFYPPPAQVDPVYLPAARLPDSPDRETRRTGDPAFSPFELRLNLDVPLRRGGVNGFASQGARAASPTLQADLRWTPVENSPWFARVTFYKYLHAGEQQPWNPDFSYAFGYDDYRPDTWSLVYANYTGTRLDPDSTLNEGHFNFDQGVWMLAYRFELPKPWEPLFLRGDGDAVLCRAGLELTPKFVDLASLSFHRNRTAGTLGCRYMRPEGWFAEFTLYAYPQHGQQQPWDPDFTYAFGWRDWRPATLSVQYSNYSGNRLPGRARAPGEGGLRSGSITLSWRVDW